MNQHIDSDDETSIDDFEKRLAAMSLVTPTAQYGLIPGKLQKSANTRWGRWHWLTAGALFCAMAVLAISFKGFIYVDSFIENHVDTSVAENSGTATQGKQGGLVGTIAAEPRFIPGKHYIELPNPIAVPDRTTVEVLAFFWYPCGPCFEFEEILNSWESEQSDGITLTRVPAIWSPTMRFQARSYFTAQVLGVLDNSHSQFYEAFEKDNTTITNEEELQLFFGTIGISAAEFLRAYYSETTMQLLEQAEMLNRTYNIQSTPVLFIAGKYGISPQGAGGLQEMLEVADFLIEGM